MKSRKLQEIECHLNIGSQNSHLSIKTGRVLWRLPIAEIKLYRSIFIKTISNLRQWFNIGDESIIVTGLGGRGRAKLNFNILKMSEDGSSLSLFNNKVLNTAGDRFPQSPATRLPDWEKKFWFIFIICEYWETIQ